MTDHLHTTFRPNSGRDTHDDPVKVLRECDLCTEPTYKAGLCKEHWQARQAELTRRWHEKKVERQQNRAPRNNGRKIEQIDAPIPFEPVRYQSASEPRLTELQKARRRYAWADFLSDDEVLRLHRENPPGAKGVTP